MGSSGGNLIQIESSYSIFEHSVSGLGNLPSHVKVCLDCQGHAMYSLFQDI